MPVPDSDLLEDKMQSEMEALRAELKKRDDEARDSLQATRRAEAHTKCRTAGFEPDEVEKTMIDNKIGDYDVAIKFMRHERELAPATPESISPMTMPKGKDLWNDKVGWAKTQAFDAINELKRNRLGAR